MTSFLQKNGTNDVFGGSLDSPTMGGESRPWTAKAMRLVSILAIVLLAHGGSRALAETPDSNEGDHVTPHSESRHLITERFVTVDKVRLRYVESGEGDAVVMIHGNAGEVEDFEYGMIDSLAGRYRVIAFDRPGHGGSERPGKQAATVEYQAKLLHEMLLQLHISRPILVGHSWGGSLALSYALQYPTETSGLVLLAPAAYPDKESNGLLRSVVKAPLVGDLSLFMGKSLLGHTMLKNDLEKAFYPQPVPDNYLKMAASSWLGTKKLRAYLEDEWTLNDSLKNMARHYSEIRVPVAIVTGDDDQIVSPKDNAYRLLQSIPQAQLIALENCGHELPLTHPDCVREALLKVFGDRPENASAAVAAAATN